ncbi:NUDIX domain-containing protein [candidate division NPL-UPA2 bacterium Unc8]|uniref:NUDIX domain-containing protein n=1 Tax=candidate division NPL-UPA2 bacterium Unc8 TaxID=1980939 RepID=A0A399FWY4_UNCN2|nr:RNA pyrophosphohydrolase [Bacillota bacterium]MBT9147063.1 RNA pyrophosphohydrolase [Bacillota bacterium]RIH99919.1 MAG: NUDIX domain-containing protein [candidate division NPL-UPA2 bacterium Unc8]
MYPKIRVSLILIEDGKLYLVKHRKEGHSYWVLPGGTVEYGETLGEAAIREIEEEINLRIELGKLAFIGDAIPPDGHRHIIDLYFTGKILGGELKLGSEEILEDVGKIDLNSLPEIDFRPDIGEDIKKAHQNQFCGEARYLGNTWEKPTILDSRL